MRFIPIFKDKLFSIPCIGGDTNYESEWDKISSLWKDPSYISNFFDKKENQQHLNAPFFRDKRLSVLQARRAFYNSARSLVLKINEVCKELKEGEVRTEQLDDFFQVIDELKEVRVRRPFLEPSIAEEGLVAVYAIRLKPNKYIITGGAIRLTEHPENQKETSEQLQLLNEIRDSLRKMGIKSDMEFCKFIQE